MENAAQREADREILPAVDTFRGGFILPLGGQVVPTIHLAMPGAQDNRIYIILKVNIA